VSAVLSRIVVAVIPSSTGVNNTSFSVILASPLWTADAAAGTAIGLVEIFH
jgi:hypothetical protein